MIGVYFGDGSRGIMNRETLGVPGISSTMTWGDFDGAAGDELVVGSQFGTHWLNMLTNTRPSTA